MAATDGTEEVTDGKIVLGFTLGKVLGRGGFGFVKEASLNDNHYAMKVLIKGEDWSEMDDKMVRGEIEIMQQLEHPNIVRVFKHVMNGKYPKGDGEEDCVIIVMELARGGNLFDILFFTDGFNEEISRTYFKQLISAVAEMHKHNITHRDIKPQNTLLDENFNLKICDFGLSKQTDGASLMTTQAGTKTFQAPEIIMGRQYDKGVDVFAIGVMLFLMLTGGEPPFRSASSEDKWFKCIAAEKPEKFWKKQKKSRRKIAGISADPEQAEELFLNMVSYQPTLRYTIEQCEAHQWTLGPTIVGAQLTEVMRQIVDETLQKKREDPNSQPEMSEKVRAMGDVLDRLNIAPVGDHFVLGYTYTVDADHPYDAFSGVQNYCLEKNLITDVDEIKFDEENFIMNFQMRFKDQTCARFEICCYKETEGGQDLISFNKKNDKFEHQTAANVFLRNLVGSVAEHLGQLHHKEFSKTTYDANTLEDLENHFNSLEKEKDVATN